MSTGDQDPLGAPTIGDAPVPTQITTPGPTTPAPSSKESLTADAQALLAASAEAAGDSISDVRKRLDAAIEGGKRVYGQVKGQVIESSRATNRAVHAHPYLAIAVGAGLGCLVGFLIRRRCACKDK